MYLRNMRWDSCDVDVVKYFLYHQRTTVLSVWDSMVHLRMSKQSDIHAWWIMLLARSRSLLMNWPSGLPQETRWDVMLAGKYAQHTIGCANAGSRDVAAALGFYWGVR